MPPNVQSETAGVHSGVGSEAELEKLGKKKRKKENPWEKQATGVPGQKWEPESWTPAPAKKR